MYKSSREIARDMCREIDKLEQIIKEKDEKINEYEELLDSLKETIDIKTQLSLYKFAHKDEQDRRRNFEEALDKIKKIAESCITPYGHIFTDEIEQIIEICKITGNNDVVHESLEDRLAKAISNKEFLEFLKKYEGKGETND